MTDQITVIGVVGSDPRPTVTAAGLPITNFRLASTRRYFDRATGQWTDGETNWYTVSTFRQLALNSAMSLHKGERVVVHGRLRVRQWETAEKSGLAVEIDADSVGHDLSWGRTTYTKTSGARAAESPEAIEPDPSAADHAWSTSVGDWETGASAAADRSERVGTVDGAEADAVDDALAGSVAV